MRFLYTLAMYLLTPPVVIRLLLRGVRNRQYHYRWRERFGNFEAPDIESSLWVHAVSVGEVNAAEPLVRALQVRYPERLLVLTTVTPTGSERARQLFGSSVFHVYLPYELPFAVSGFLDRIKPALAIIVETEIWPNLYRACRRRGIPLLIVNARLSERSMRGYRALGRLVRDSMACVSYVAAQSQADAERYRELGAPAERVGVTGYMKFDTQVPADAVSRGMEWRQQWGACRPVWIAASTHEGEEQAVWHAHTTLLEKMPNALLLIAARHPERFRVLESQARGLGLAVATRRQNRVARPHHQVFVIDSMGELMPFFAAVDVAFVGGSLCPVGGHNVLEPAALSKPVVVGPYTFNFEGITATLLEAGAAVRVNDATELAREMAHCLSDPERRLRMGEAGRRVFERERGAVGRVMQLIDTALQ
ncbi:lipid IV(A) 3-deoxy-D-manno-octulosonic acid transferase [Frateuria aurantia]